MATASDYETPAIRDRIQPHGTLLAIDTAELTVTNAATNAPELLGVSELLGSSVAGCFGNGITQFLHNLVELTAGQFLTDELIAVNGQSFYATAHRPLRGTEPTFIVELEPLPKRSPASGHMQLHALLGRLRQAPGVDALLERATAALRQLTGCDRVMAYRFDETGAGAVVAESLGTDVEESYFGLHYPASDVPTEARLAYQYVALRYIPDFQAEPTPFIKPDPETIPDLGLALLSNPSDCCRDYHCNIGAVALTVVPLLQGGKLWGLLSCHHSAPRTISPARRTDCALLGQVVALELAEREAQAERAYDRHLQSLRAGAMTALTEGRDLKALLLAPESNLLALTGATGAAICLGEEISLVGATPSLETVRSLRHWAESYLGEETLLATHTLGALYPPAATCADTASGLLLLQLSRLRRWTILWFRPEVPQSVTWAGNPNLPFQTSPDTGAPIGPRNSFDRWQELTRGSARPWQTAELQSAREFRNAIVGVVLQKADELEHLVGELERSNQELASFAYAASHDLKEPLRGIHNYAAFLLEDYGERLDATGRDRLEVLVRLSQRMENLIDVLLHYSLLGQADLNAEPTDLNVLAEREIELFRLSRSPDAMEFRLPRPLPVVTCDPTLLGEVFANLIGNAYKYSDKARRWLEIGYLTPAEQIQQRPSQTPQGAVLLYARDNGIGIAERHHETIFRLFKRLHSRDRYGGGTGAGLAIARRIIERHNGQLWVDSTPGTGSTFYFYLSNGQSRTKT